MYDEFVLKSKTIWFYFIDPNRSNLYDLYVTLMGESLKYIELRELQYGWSKLKGKV